jgi:peroxiredoxin Q/BCP
MKNLSLFALLFCICAACNAEMKIFINDKKPAVLAPIKAEKSAKKVVKEKKKMSSEFKIGDLAPDFTLNDQDGKAQTLSSYKGKFVLVYFYPKDDTPGCTTEACSIRDNVAQFSKYEVKVFGISADDVASHKKFIAKYKLPFDLLADTNKTVAKLYGADGLFIKRISFLIDKEGKFAKLYPSVNPSQHAGEILADLASLTQHI